MSAGAKHRRVISAGTAKRRNGDVRLGIKPAASADGCLRFAPVYMTVSLMLLTLRLLEIRFPPWGNGFSLWGNSFSLWGKGLPLWKTVFPHGGKVFPHRGKIILLHKSATKA
jgi:hypothetical protein